MNFERRRYANLQKQKLTTSPAGAATSPASNTVHQSSAQRVVPVQTTSVQRSSAPPVARSQQPSTSTGWVAPAQPSRGGCSKCGGRR